MTTQVPPSQQVQDRIARSIAARLTDASNDLPHDVSERLRVVRMQALARRKVEASRTATSSAALGRSGQITLGAPESGWWNRLTSALALVALVVGLVGIAELQDDLRANELAEVDAELLTDDLPPAAYTDPGFAQYLRSNPNR